jgi:hypothetical protein
MNTRAHSSWQRAAQLQREPHSSERVLDLAHPDAQSAQLAEQLQAVHTQITFFRVVIFGWRWVLRPLLWWPVKYYGRLLAFAFIWQKNNTSWTADNEEQRRRDDEEESERHWKQVL